MAKKVAFLFDMIMEDEVTNGLLKSDSRSVALFRYLTGVVKAADSTAETRLFIAAPKPGKATAKGLKEHAESIKKALDDFDATLVCVMGKSSIYAVASQLPGDFPATAKYQRLWGKYFTANPRPTAPASHRKSKHSGTTPATSGSGSGPGDSDGQGVRKGRRTIVFTPSPSMVWASKGQEGGYLHLRTLTENITGALLQATDSISTVSTLVGSRDELLAIEGRWTAGSKLIRLSNNAVIAVDTETTGLNIVTDKVRTVQFSAKDGEAYVVPFELLQPDDWTQLFHRLRAAGYTLVLQNGKYDSKILAGNGVTLGAYSELSTAHVLVDERAGTHNLDFIGQQLLGSGKTEITTEQLVNGPINAQFVHYAGRDTDVTRRAYNILFPSVRSKPAFSTLTKAAQFLAEGESFGIKLAQDRLQVLTEQATAQMKEYQAMFDEIGLNPSSPKQVKEMLGMAGKSDKGALAELGTDLATAIIDYRGLVKVKSSYLDRLQASANVDGRFHPDIRLAGPVTGRTSSGSGSAPEGMLWLPINSQNIPRPNLGQENTYRSEALRAELRHLFIADEGRVMLGMDLAAAEMRMAANACMDPVMIDDLNRKVDTHALLTIMAKKLPFEIDLDNPKPWVDAVKENYAADRQATKNATFATLYGGGLGAIAQQAGCDIATARTLRDTIFERYQGLEAWIRNVHSQIRTTGRITTRYGRQRIFPYNTGVFDNQQLQGMLREGQNSIIQSEASDYCLMGLNKFMENLPRHFKPVYVQNMVHDALYFSVAEEDAEEAQALLVQCVESADALPAKMYADAHYAQSWGTL